MAIFGVYLDAYTRGQVTDGTAAGVQGVTLKLTAEELIFKSCLLRIYEQANA